MFSLITLICSIKVEMHYAHAPADWSPADEITQETAAQPI
jgi:hypothetical protein